MGGACYVGEFEEKGAEEIGQEGEETKKEGIKYTTLNYMFNIIFVLYETGLLFGSVCTSENIKIKYQFQFNYFAFNFFKFSIWQLFNSATFQLVVYLFYHLFYLFILVSLFVCILYLFYMFLFFYLHDVQ